MNHENVTMDETLPFQDVIRFFDGLPVKSECPMCSASSWEIPVLKGKDDQVVLSESGHSIDQVPVLEVKICCNNCGFYRSHKVSVVKLWIANNPEKTEAPSE